MIKKDQLTCKGKSPSFEGARFLRYWEEVVGVLANVEIDESVGLMYLVFGNGDSIALPFHVKMIDSIDDCIGCSIGILHTDLPKNPYILKKLGENIFTTG